MEFPYRGEVYSILCAVLWAFAVVLFRRSGDSIPPLALNLLKCAASSLLFFPTLWLAGIGFWPEVAHTDLFLLAASGLIGITLADTLFLKSLNLLGAGLSQVVACLYSPFVIFFSLAFLGESLAPWDIAGTILILSGVLLTVERNPQEEVASRRTAGVLIGAAAFAFMALGVVLAKPALGRTSLLWASGFRLVTATVGLAVLLPLFARGRRSLARLRPSGAWKTALLASFVGTYLAMIVWLAGVKYTAASVASILNQTSAVFVLPFAAVILKEPVTARHLIALSLALGGVILVTLL